MFLSVHVQEKSLSARMVEELFIAVGKRWTNPFALRRPIPIGSRGHGARIGRKADQSRLLPVAFANELPNVELTLCPHRSGARVAEVRIMRPDDGLYCLPRPVQMREQRIKRIGHMSVAHVPGADRTIEHAAIIHFGILYQASVLQYIEKFILRDPSVTLVILSCFMLQLLQLVENGPLAGWSEVQTNDIAVILCIPAKTIEASIASACPLSGLRVYPIQVADDGFDRG